MYLIGDEAPQLIDKKKSSTTLSVLIQLSKWEWIDREAVRTDWLSGKHVVSRRRDENNCSVATYTFSILCHWLVCCCVRRFKWAQWLYILFYKSRISCISMHPHLGEVSIWCKLTLSFMFSTSRIRLMELRTTRHRQTIITPAPKEWVKHIGPSMLLHINSICCHPNEWNI